jgi:hypothetical protein
MERGVPRFSTSIASCLRQARGSGDRTNRPRWWRVSCSFYERRERLKRSQRPLAGTKQVHDECARRSLTRSQPPERIISPLTSARIFCYLNGQVVSARDKRRGDSQPQISISDRIPGSLGTRARRLSARIPPVEPTPRRHSANASTI